MKESVKITVIAAGFREVNRKPIEQKASFLPKTWKAGRDPESEPVAKQEPVPAATVVHHAQPRVAQAPEVVQEVPADDLEVPTFLRRQAQKA